MQDMQNDKWVERGLRLRKTLINFASAIWFIGTAIFAPVFLAYLACLMASGEKNPALHAGFYGVMFGAALASLLIVCVDRKVR